MKTKPTPRARRMWANYYPNFTVPDIYSSKARAISWATNYPATVTVPVAVIPLDDKGALVRCAYEASRIPGFDGFAQMTAALTAIGVLPKSKGGRK